jgi:hypothetical protein
MDNYYYIMCEEHELESRNHMCFHFPFAKLCWQYVCPSCTPPQQVDIQSIIASLKIALKMPFFYRLTFRVFLQYVSGLDDQK